MHEADVVVVGAGPAGSVSALLFARQGFRTVLLDRSHFPRPKACAEYMSPGVVRALHDVGVGGSVADLNPAHVPGMDIISPRGRIFPVTYDGLPAWTAPRTAFDATLVREAVRAGAQLREGFVARDILRDSGAVSGVTGTREGRTETVSARLTVVADGARSVLARRLGVARSARWPVRLGLVAHFAGTAPLVDGRGQMHVGQHGYCGVAPLPGGHFNVAVVTRLDAPRQLHMSAETFFEHWISSHPHLAGLLRGTDRVTPVRGVGPIGARSERVQFPGCVLVGDAASFFDPFTGEGIYRALLGAQLAAQVGERALETGSECSGGLERYECLRRVAFGRKSAVTSLVQLFVQYPPLLEYALPRLARRPSPARTLRMVLGDVEDARQFLRPAVMWGALRP